MPAAEVYRALWRHRLMIVVLTAVAGIAAYAYVRTQPTVYQANALVRIQQRAATPAEAYGSLSSLELGQRLAQTYAKIVVTNTLHERVASALSDSVPDSDISISASPVGDIELLTISAQNENPEVAARVANATTVALRKFVKETGTLRDQIVLIDRATAPDTPIAPRPKMTIAIALVLAILFNCALALGREFFADRLPEVEDWESRFGRPVLATVPSLNLKVPSEVLTPARRLAETPAPVMSTEALAGPTRWSIGRPEVSGGS